MLQPERQHDRKGRDLHGDVRSGERRPLLAHPSQEAEDEPSRQRPEESHRQGIHAEHRDPPAPKKSAWIRSTSDSQTKATSGR